MTQYPVVLEAKVTDAGVEVKATTSLGRAMGAARPLEADLRCIEIDYQTTLAAVKGALSSARDGRYRDPRAYWFAGKYLAEFLDRLQGHGFYLVEKNIAPATHLGISRASVEKMIAFFHRYPNPFEIDTSVPWSKYRDNIEGSMNTADPGA
ncbi:MAG: hypothetical protein ACLQVA_06485 [Candidatus Brocadiia bacterium]